MTILADNIRRAAHGRHRCGWCQRPIAARERYRDLRHAQDGTVWTWREHLACGAFMLRHADPFDWPIEYPIETYQEMVEEHGDPLTCPTCAGVGHLGPATGASQRDYGRACPTCSTAPASDQEDR